MGAESLQILTPAPPPHHCNTGHHGDIVLSPLLRRVSWSLCQVWRCLGGDNDWGVLECGGHQAAADQAACLHRLTAAPAESSGLGWAELRCTPPSDVNTHTI